MTVFDKPFLFFDNPRGGTDQLDKAKAAGFAGGFGNCIDYPASDWDVHRQHAAQAGMFFGPWGRTGHPPPQGTGFEHSKAQKIMQTALNWNAPYVLNVEKEADNTGDAVTLYIKGLVGSDDCALSTEAWPFGSVDWKPVGHLSVLPQIFPPDWGWAGKTQSEIMARAQSSKDAWHVRGFKCVYYTFSSYGGMTPGQFDLKAPYSLFTADAIGISNYGLWKPTSTGFKGCIDMPTPPPPDPEPVPALTTKFVREKMANWAAAWESGQKPPGPKPLTRITIAKEIVRYGGISDASWKAHSATFRALVDQAEQDE